MCSILRHFSLDFIGKVVAYFAAEVSVMSEEQFHRRQLRARRRREKAFEKNEKDKVLTVLRYIV